MQLTEKYRPRRFSQLVGQDKAVSTVRRIVGRKGWDRDSFWLSGPSGGADVVFVVRERLAKTTSK